MEEARGRIAQSTNQLGRDRDPRTLEAAALAFGKLWSPEPEYLRAMWWRGLVERAGLVLYLAALGQLPGPIPGSGTES